MTNITCPHPLDKIRVVWHIVSRMSSYRVLKPRAHCIGCNTTLHDTDKQAIMAIDLVMVEAARREKYANAGIEEIKT